MLKERTFFESIFVLIATIVFSILIGLLASVSLKFQIAFGLGLFGFILICLLPARRTICLCLWVLIQPLSIEKIVYTNLPIWNYVEGQDVVINAADLILIALFVILIIENLILQKGRFVWNKITALFFALLLWGIFSYLTHLGFYDSEYVNAAPIGIQHLLRNFLFVIIIGSAIQTRKDIIWILVTITIIILLESILTGLSFATGEPFNFSRLIGIKATVQEYYVGGNTVTRATGTLGVSNQQASFHALFTLLIIGVFALRNKLLNALATIVILSSFIAVLFTFSRAAWLALAIASITIIGIFIYRKEITSGAWLVGGFVSVLLIIILAMLAQPITDRLTKGDNGSTSSRMRMISLATDLALTHPIIGVGPNEYAEAGLYLYPPGEKETEWVPLGEKAIVPPLGRIELAVSINPEGKHKIFTLGVHNKYLLIVSELGVVGLAIWLLIFYYFYKNAKQCANMKDPLFRFIGVAGIGIWIVSFIYMNLDLFDGEKILQILLFPFIFISATYRIGKKYAFIPSTIHS